MRFEAAASPPVMLAERLPWLPRLPFLLYISFSNRAHSIPTALNHYHDGHNRAREVEVAAVGVVMNEEQVNLRGETGTLRQKVEAVSRRAIAKVRCVCVGCVGGAVEAIAMLF